MTSLHVLARLNKRYGGLWSKDGGWLPPWCLYILCWVDKSWQGCPEQGPWQTSSPKFWASSSPPSPSPLLCLLLSFAFSFAFSSASPSSSFSSTSSSSFSFSFSAALLYLLFLSFLLDHSYGFNSISNLRLEV